MGKIYNIVKIERPPYQERFLSDKIWEDIADIKICEFRKESSRHRPQTTCRMFYDNSGLYALFYVKDRYVKAVYSKSGDPVYEDSCVEFFVQPSVNSGYFNFEFNCCGTLLATYITDPARTENGFAEYTPLDAADIKNILIYPSVTGILKEEITTPFEWKLGFFIPFSLFANYAKTATPSPGDEWRANFYKCGDKTSHPHWGAWSPVPELNFHIPESFGHLKFMGNLIEK